MNIFIQSKHQEDKGRAIAALSKKIHAPLRVVELEGSWSWSKGLWDRVAICQGCRHSRPDTWRWFPRCVSCFTWFGLASSISGCSDYRCAKSLLRFSSRWILSRKTPRKRPAHFFNKICQGYWWFLCLDRRGSLFYKTKLLFMMYIFFFQ